MRVKEKISKLDKLLIPIGLLFLGIAIGASFAVNLKDFALLFVVLGLIMIVPEPVYKVWLKKKQ